MHIFIGEKLLRQFVCTSHNHNPAHSLHNDLFGFLTKFKIQIIELPLFNKKCFYAQFVSFEVFWFSRFNIILQNSRKRAPDLLSNGYFLVRNSRAGGLRTQIPRDTKLILYPLSHSRACKYLYKAKQK